MTRTVCVITGSRAEYGHLRWLVRGLRDDDRFRLRVLVTGMHLEPRFGESWREIEADGVAIDARVPMDETDDSADGIARSMAKGLTGMSEALGHIEPDVALILGDRFEMMAAAQAAMLHRIPIAHLHGGETTEGAMDEAIRHAITKMAHLHFAAAEPYRQRILQLGEDPERVFNVGAPGLDAVEAEDAMSTSDLSADIGFDLSGGYFLVTYHPVTLELGDTAAPLRAVLAALDGYPDRKVLITGVNADHDSGEIEAVYRAHAERNPERVHIVTHLGQRRYLSALRGALACVGNSSSGVIEAPAFGVPTVNVGSRQQGRLRAASVIDCGGDEVSIRAALEKAMDPAFRASVEGIEPPYGRAGASERIKEILANAPLDGILMKRFNDLDAG